MTDSPLPRRDYLITASAAISGISLAGCLESDVDDDGGTDNQEDGAPPNEVEEQDSEDRPTIEGFSASDIRRDDEEQRVRLSLSNVEVGEEVDVYIDITSLREANIDVDSLGALAESQRPGWSVTDEELIVNERILFRVTATVESDEDYIEDIGTINIDLFRLGTEEIEHLSGLQHYATLTFPEQEPDFENPETTTYDTIDPAELENLLGIAPQDIRAGDTEQEVLGEIGHATSEIDLRMDINPVTEAGVGISHAEVVVDSVTDGNRNQETVEVIETNVTDGIVRVQFEVDAEMIAFEFRITNIETDDVERMEEVTYPIFTGERPSDPERSRPFEVSGVTA